MLMSLFKTFMNILLAISVIGLAACEQKTNEPTKYATPDDLYSEQDPENPLHPAGYLSRISELPENDCEKEQLRRLVIALNMYSEEYLNQSYFLEADSDGAKILLSTFPSLKETNGVMGERNQVMRIDKTSHHLRGLSFLCKK